LAAEKETAKVSVYSWLPTRLAAAILAAVAICACRPTADEQQATSTTTSTATAASAPASRPECTDIVERFSRALTTVQSQSPVERLAEIRAAGAAAGEDPAGCVTRRLETLVTEQRRKLVRLSVNEQDTPAAAIYECPELGPDLRCDGAVADDTAHLGELSVGNAVSGSRDVRMEIAPQYQPTSTTFYLLKTAGGSLEAAQLPLRSVPSVYAMVAIVKEMVDAGYVKYVWLVRAP
jgi:hypothetical protein